MFNPIAYRISTHWQRAMARLAHLPSQCAICHAWPAQRICNDCATRFAQPRPRCTTCALPVAEGVAHCTDCLHPPYLLNRCVAAVDYGFPWSDALLGFKFGGDPTWAGPLALLIRSSPWAEPMLEEADKVVPMPLSSERLRQRGFNQALLLARQLAPHKTDATLLLRVHDTVAQSSLRRGERLHNLEGAFLVEPLRASTVRGQRIILIDDVMTTGATLHTAAAVLRKAGAAQVSALVVARTSSPQWDADE